MGDQLQREASAVAHAPRRWKRRGLILLSLVLVLAGILLITLVLRKPTERDCAAVSRDPTVPDGVTVGICKREYERTRLPATGSRLANALRRDRESVVEWKAGGG